MPPDMDLNECPIFFGGGNSPALIDAFVSLFKHEQLPLGDYYF